MSQDIPWHVTRRLLEFRGEERANLLRLLGITAFYLLHLLNRYGLAIGPVSLDKVEGITSSFHAAVTALAVIWAVLAGMILLLLRNRVMPRGLKYASTLADAVLLSGVLMIADGPSSPVALVFLLLIALAALRGNTRLVGVATGASLLGYGLVVGQCLWKRPDLLPSPHVMITAALGMVLMGVVMAQITTAFRNVAQLYAAQGLLPRASDTHQTGEDAS